MKTANPINQGKAKSTPMTSWRRWAVGVGRWGMAKRLGLIFLLPPQFFQRMPQFLLHPRLQIVQQTLWVAAAKQGRLLHAPYLPAVGRPDGDGRRAERVGTVRDRDGEPVERIALQQGMVGHCTQRRHRLDTPAESLDRVRAGDPVEELP